MIGKLLLKMFRGFHAGRNGATAKKMIRRIAIEPLESRRLLAVTGSLSGYAYLDTHDFGVKDADEAGYSGLTVQLQSVSSQGNLSSVAGVGPIQTHSDGSYGFTGLAAGTYQIQILPPSSVDVGILSLGSAGGTAGNNEIQVTLAAGQSATDYNFAILGAQGADSSTPPSALDAGPLVGAAAVGTAPAGYSITANQATINASQATSTGFTFAGATTNTTYNYTITSSGASGSVSGSGSVTSATQDVTGINVSSLPNGTLTYSVTLTDTSSEVGAPATASATLDTVAPSGYTIAANQSTVNLSDDTSTGFTFTGATTGTTYNYTVGSTGGSGTVSGSGSVTSATQDVTGINVSSLANGTLTYSVTLTDAAGNTGTAATATATLNTVVPSGYSIAANQATINLSDDTSTGFTFTGATTGTTYNYTVTSSGGGASVSGSGSVTSASQDVTGINVSSLANGTLTYSVTLTSAAGNTGAAATATASFATGSLSGFVNLSNGTAFPGITVQLSMGSSTPLLTQSLADGSYSFSGLAAGSYELQILPSSKLAAASTENQVTLTAGGNSTGNDFTITGPATDEISIRMNLASSGTEIQFLTSMHTAPSVATGGSGGSTPTTTYTTGGSGAAIAPSATILAPDSPTLTSMTVTIENPPDGAGEKLTANTAGTTLTSNYANGVLTISGVADTATYQTVLQSVQYTDTASTATPGDRTISIAVNDGTDTNTIATVTVDVVQGANTAPSVTANPTSKAVSAGSSVTFTAAAGGSPTPTVQWEVSTNSGTSFSAVSGATSTSFTFTASSAENGDEYEAVFTNSVGSATSTVATLTVQTAPTVTTNPASKTVNVGGTATFTAAASSTPAASVQWQVSSNGGTTFTSITGATSTTYSFAASSAENADVYEAVFTNVAGSATSTPATLTVDHVSTEPLSQTANAGAQASFTALSSNPSGADTVQWEMSSNSGGTFTAISGAITTNFSFAATSGENGNEYEAVFSNSNGTFASSPATLTVDFAPAVTTNPTNLLANANGTATFTAAASGNPAPTVQWEMKTNGGSSFSPISGATSTTYSFTATSGENGNQYEAVFSNTINPAATTSAATLTVDTVTTEPASQTVATGAPVTFTSTSSNPGGDTVQWKISTSGGATFTAISGATSTTYSFTATNSENGDEYEAVFSNSAGSLTSSPATLTVNFPATVTTNPSNQLVDAGNAATFTAAAAGNPTPTVQWKVSIDGGATFNNITAATSTTYSFTPTSGDTGEEFEAVFTNGLGSPVTTSAATLTVDSVTTQPAGQTVNAGATATFTAGTSHSGDTVQWKLSSDGGTTFNAISGATSTTYSFTATSGENGDEYEAVFSNSAGSLTSTPATLSVDFSPIVTTQPANQTVSAGNTATFTAAANANPSATVQWQVSTDGGTTYSAVTGATSTTYSFTATSGENGDQYEADFSNSLGTFASNPATLTVDFAPTVTTSPTGQTVDAGGTATFAAAASGNPAPSVQWEVSSNGGTSFTAITGATSTTYSFTATGGENADEYEAVFTNGVGSPATTLAATLTVDHVTTEPANQTYLTGATATFTAISSNPSGADTVQWQVSSNGGTTFNAITGATSTTYSFTATSGENGDQFEAVFSNSAGTFTSSPATLTVDFAPTVTTNPTDQTADAGGTATFTAAASGNPAPTVEWEVSTDGGASFSAISGATSTTFSFTPISGDNGNEYEAVFTNGIGAPATTSAATLTVDSVTTQPSSQTVDAGATATFTAASANPSGDTVQWKVSTSGGTTFTAISGATSTTYSFTATSSENGDQYEAVFSNSNGAFTSSPATLTVDFAPTLTTNPASQTVGAGGTATFAAAGKGNPAPTVQWEVSSDGGTTFSAVSGATSTTYSFTATAGETGDEYEAVFTNSLGSITSSPATLTVASQPAVTGISPATGPAGTTVTITGTGFTGATNVDFGANMATNVVVVSATQITATSPAGSGTVDVTVTGPGGTSPTSSADQFTYISVTGISPASGPIPGGTTVTITGTGFTGATKVDFGPTAATNVIVVSATQITATSPAEPSNTVNGVAVPIDVVDVTVTGPFGTTTTSSADQFTYMTVTGVSPTVGPLTGDTAVTITGTGFTGATKVDFGANPATNLVVVSSTEITVTSPAGSGTVDVTVTGPGGTTSTSSTDKFSYVAAPTVIAVSSTKASGVYGAGTTIPITVTFDEPVTVTGAPQIALNAGGGATATYASGSGTATLTFNYTVAAGQLAADLDYASTTALSLNGGTIKDSAGNGAALTLPATSTDGLATTNIVINTTPAGGFSIVPEYSVVNDLDNINIGFAFSGAATGTYTYRVISTGGSKAVTGSGAVTSATQRVTGINVSTLQDGNLTFVVTLTNVAGTSMATATATLDTKAPSGYSIALDEATINAPEAQDFGLTITTPQAEADVGNTYHITIGSSTDVNITGTVTSASQHVSDINLSSIPDGEIIVIFALENTAGDVGSVVTKHATLNAVAPSGYAITADQAIIGPGATAGFTLLGAGTFVSSIAGIAPATYNYTITSSGGGGSVTGSGTVTSATQDITGINVSSLPNGNLTYSVTLTGPAGYVGTAATAAAALERAAPAGYSVSANDPIVTTANEDSTGFTIQGAQPLPGTTYNYSIASSGGGSPVSGTGAVTAATQTVSGINVSSLNDGAVTYSVTLTDAGGTGTAATASATLDKEAPAGYSITATPAVVNLAGETSAGFTFADAIPNATYQFTVTSSGGAGSVTGSGSVTSATESISNINVTSLPDGTLTFSVSLTVSGVSGAPVEATATLDTVFPGAFTVTPDESQVNEVGGFTLGGAQTGTTYTYTITGSGGSPVTGSGAVTSATQDVTGINLSSLPDGTVTFSVTLTNAAGNTNSPVTATATIDSTAPTEIALSTSVAPSSQPVGSLVGILQTVGPQSTSNYTYSLVSGNGGTDNGSFQIVNDELQTNATFTAGQAPLSILVQSTDPQTNQSIQQVFQITVSNTDPVTPTVSLSNNTISTGQTGVVASQVGTLGTTGPIVGSQVNYSLVSGAGDDNNSSFQIGTVTANGQSTQVLETVGTLAPGTYTVRVRSSSTFLISDVENLTGITGPTAFEVSLDPSQLPSGSFTQVAAAAGLITLSSDAAGNWNPAVSTNAEKPGSLAQTNYQGPYSSFWSSVTAANPSATLQNVVGSSGIDLATNEVWAVVDRPGDYAVGAQVYTEQVFTITITS